MDLSVCLDAFRIRLLWLSICIYIVGITDLGCSLPYFTVFIRLPASGLKKHPGQTFIVKSYTLFKTQVLKTGIPCSATLTRLDKIRECSLPGFDKKDAS